MDKKVHILYITYVRDFEWLRFSLESFYKYGKGFSGITICVPTWDEEKFKWFLRYSTKECPITVKSCTDYPGRGFLHHLAMKCSADILVPADTDYVLHMDPDCLWIKPFTPDDYFTNGKPDLLIEPYSEIAKYHQGRHAWKAITDRALGWETTHETMCRHPAVHPINLYKQVREHMESLHRVPFYHYVIAQQNKFPWGFCEFNTLGGYAMKYRAKDYNFIDRGDKGEKADPDPKLTQFWSYDGTAKSIKEITEILK